MSSYEARIEVGHRPGILDPQGGVIERALPALGYANVTHVRVGKSIRLAVDAADEAAARAQVEEMCRKLLANPVIEDFTVEIVVAPVSARVGVVQFPGTNCEQDVAWAVKVLGGTPEMLWHADRSLAGVDAVVLAGGFAHGDYLRTGAIARFSPVMDAVADFAASGGPVVGICNGFQILCEAGLLPGALQKNAGLKFRCQTTDLRVETTTTVLTSGAERGQILRIPINHFEGNYVCDDTTLKAIQAGDQVVLRYVENPNGSLDDIAGICNEGRNVVGLMPHPERASEAILGSTDGAVLLGSLLASAAVAGRR